MDRLSHLPFLLAFYAAVAAMPTNVYQICAWDVGTLALDPWRTTTAVVRNVTQTIANWLSRLFTRRMAFACAAIALALLASHLGASHHDGFFAVAGVTIPELLQKKGELAEQAQQILNAAADDNNRDLKTDEETRFDTIHADIERVTKQIGRLTKQETVTKSFEESQGRRAEPNQIPNHQHRATRPGARGSLFDGVRAWLIPEDKRTDDMRQAAIRGGINLNAKEITVKLLADQALKGLDRESVRDWEERAQGVATGGAGGFTVPDSPMQALEKALLFFGGMRSVATVIRTDTGASLPFPTVNDTAQAGVLLAENTQVSNQDATFAQLTMDAYKYSSKAILISVELLQDNAINAANVIGQLLGERLGRIQNTHFTTGTGSSQPNGVVTAATLGKTGATGQTTSVIYDDLVDLLHSVDPAYRPSARWMFHDGTLKALKKIKVAQFSGDTNGMPLWQPGLVLGQPDTILGYPFTINNDVATMSANAKSVLFGALDKYLIREVRDITLIRLEERYADFHQVGFLAFARVDGDLLNAGTNPVKYYANSAT